MSGAARFRAMREMIGASQADVAHALDVEQRSVNRWECGENPIPPRAWLLLEAWKDENDDRAAEAIEMIEAAVKSDGFSGTVMMPYYRSQRHYDQYGRDKGEFGRVNAVSRDVAMCVEDICDVEWVYPEDAGWIEEARK